MERSDMGEKRMREMILNLSSWIERREKEIGPYAEHIIHSVKHYEAEITARRAESQSLREALKVYADPCDDSGDGCGYEGNMCCQTARAALKKEGQYE